ncbi:glycosyltransferase [[Phormidium ambiguum] IAM M-71]|uniref:Glycosyltransferase n=2 Tax=[Phormidium ambiguum] IAM M-71 TaxID=454136 RepID=A0A1U7ISJ0_9CYAN|nr:glycosyltransferase [Phormidium ambiguum IAM M-71]
MPWQKQLIHFWIPNIFQFKGGIQTYSAFLIEALQSLHSDKKYEIFLKHDTSSSTDLSFLANTKFHFAGAVPLQLRTLLFAMQIIINGLYKKPDLVITTHLNFSIVSYLLKRFRGISYWTVVHGVEAWDIQRPNLKIALQHADRIISVSNYTRDRLLKEQQLDPDKISLLPNTFDADRFKIAPKPEYLLKRYGLTVNHSIILTVARLDQDEQYKGYDQIIQALPEIRRHIPNIHYILVGKGSDRSRITQLISQLNLQDCVTLAGFIPDSELGDHYNLCDVFAMPSKGEGFGIVYLEALACGKPTLGGNKDGAVDALCHGELGALVDPDNVTEIAQVLTQILQKKFPHPIMYQPEILRQKVIEIYGFARFKQTLKEIIQTLN